MTEKNLSNDQDPFSDAAAHEYLDSFLSQIGAPEADDIPPYDRKIMVDPVLAVHQDPLNFDPSSNSKRDELVAYFDDKNWLPKQQQEAGIAAIKGVDEAVRRAKHTASGDSEKAQAETLATVRRYYRDAVLDVRTLNAVRVRREGYSIEPSVESLRANRPAMYVIADMLLAREFLDKADWPNSNWNHYQSRQEYWRGFMLFAARYGSDEVLADTFKHFYEKAQQRRKFWSGEFHQIDKKIGHLALPAAEPMTRESAVPDEDDEEASGRPQGGISFDELIPEGAQQDLERLIRQFADQTKQIDGYVQDQGMTWADAERKVLSGRARWYKGHVIGIEPKQTKNPPVPRKQRSPKTRRGLGWRGRLSADEPPPGVDDERRTY